MATLAPAAKMRRVLEFLIGVRDDRVRAALGTHGFTERDRVQGWELLRALGMTQSVAPPIATASPALDALDEWRGHWLRVARASLTRDYPQVLATVFAGLDKPNQPSLSVVTVFVQLYDSGMAAGAAAAVAPEQAAEGGDQHLALVEDVPPLLDRQMHRQEGVDQVLVDGGRLHIGKPQCSELGCAGGTEAIGDFDADAGVLGRFHNCHEDSSFQRCVSSGQASYVPARTGPAGQPPRTSG